jgi:hypothetical protein
MKNWKKELERYGNIGLVVYLSIFVLTMGIMITVVETGSVNALPWFRDHPEITSGATWVAAWAMTKVLQVPRILLTLALTPMIARWTGRSVSPGASDSS